jgi:dTDP-4-amino-4,6-dideoxygalactose transaminase
MALPEEPLAHVYHLFVVKCEHRDMLLEHLGRYDIQSLIHYPISIHQQESCRNIARSPQGLTNSEHHAATCLSIPCHPQLEDSDIDHIIETLNLFQVVS